jgi:hypothetical protein
LDLKQLLDATLPVDEKGRKHAGEIPAVHFNALARRKDRMDMKHSFLGNDHDICCNVLTSALKTCSAVMSFMH